MNDKASPQRWTRRRFFEYAGAGIAATAVTGSFAGKARSALSDGRGVRASPPSGTVTFVSRPDLTAPSVAVAVPAVDPAPGYIFVACATGPGQRGPMIIDNQGQLVWFRPRPADGSVAMNFRVLRYRGKPVLVWWEGQFAQGYGDGEYVIADTSYRTIQRVRAGGGLPTDLHEFLITEDGTAYLTSFEQVPFDLSALGGDANGMLTDSIVQEVDIASGRLLFEWRATDHIGIDETYTETSNDVLDFFHANSIDVDRQGNVLLSARNTSALYKIDRSTGDILWRLGGRKSDFALGPGAPFYWQHHARWQGPGVITVFDDGSGDVKNEPASRGIRLAVNETAKTVTLIAAYVQPNGLLAFAEGSMQQLANSGAFVGWGSIPRFSEFAPDGSLRFDGYFPAEGTSYRAFRDVWHAKPKTVPTVVIAAPSGVSQAFVSWNGATEVAHWRLLAGVSPSALEAVRTVARQGFETRIGVPGGSKYVRVDALDGSGRVLASSHPVAT